MLLLITRRNGDIYRGTWQDNKKHGEGEFIADHGSGDKFTGTFENDNKLFGKYEFSDGDVYEGGYEEDQQEGLGRNLQMPCVCVCVCVVVCCIHLSTLCPK